MIELDDVEVPSGRGELRGFVISALVENFGGQEIQVSSTGDSITMLASRTQAQQAAKSRNPLVGNAATQMKGVIEGSVLTDSSPPEDDLWSSKKKNARFQDAVAVKIYSAPVRMGGQDFGVWFSAIEKTSGTLQFDSLGVTKIVKPQGQRTTEKTPYPPQAASVYKVGEFGHKVNEAGESPTFAVRLPGQSASMEAELNRLFVGVGGIGVLAF